MVRSFPALVLFAVVTGAAPVIMAQGAANLNIQAQTITPAKSFKPRNRGDIVCADLAFPAFTKTVCNYIPVYETAANLQTRILRQFFGGRQPSNPDESYVIVTNTNQLEFAASSFGGAPNTMIELIKARLADFDVLDTYVPQRRVNLGIRVVQLLKNADENLGFMVSKATYSGSRGNPVAPTDRLSVGAAVGSILSAKFAIGNLVNSLLEITLMNFKENRDINIIKVIPLPQVKHGDDISYDPQSQNQYISTSSVSSQVENAGIRINGQVRFFENINTKIVIKNFSVVMSDLSRTEAVDKTTPGVEKHQTRTMDLELEIGCSAAIRVLNVLESVKSNKRNFIFSSEKGTNESEKDLLLIVQALDEAGNEGAVAPNCSQTVVRSAAEDRP